MKKDFYNENREDAEQKPLSMTPCLSVGFTLIELLVVVLIIGILSAVALPQYRKAVLRAKMTEAIVNTKAIYDAQQLYKMETGEYTDNFEDLGLGYKVNENNPTYASLSKGVCSLVNAKTGNVIYCNLTGVLSFQRVLINNQIVCCSYPDTDYIADSICKAETGDTEWHNGCGESEPCHCFTSN